MLWDTAKGRVGAPYAETMDIWQFYPIVFMLAKFVKVIEDGKFKGSLQWLSRVIVKDI